VRILFVDRVKKPATVITSVNETPGYPAENLASDFLNEQYISIFPDDVITIDLGSDTELNCVFLAYLNAAVFDIEIRNNASSVVYSGADVSNSRAVLPIYLGSTVTGRYIEISADASLGLASFVDTEIDMGQYLKMKGTGAGVYFETEDGGPLNGHDLGVFSGTTSVRSKTGQILATQFPFFAARKWDFAAQTYAAAQDFLTNLKLLGLQAPTYMDFFPGTTELDAPLYAAITRFAGPKRSGVEFTYSFDIEEAR
jgi:hypothetical protein